MSGDYEWRLRVAITNGDYEWRLRVAIISAVDIKTEMGFANIALQQEFFLFFLLLLCLSVYLPFFFNE
jgi:hypothetical protein